MDMILSPSILNADYGNMAELIRKAENAGADWLHLDVMDGVFVPNISFGIPVIQSLRKYSNLFFDTHLMITEPEKYIERFIEAGADGITFHIEATKNPDKCIDLIRRHNKQAAIAISPDTPVSSIRDYIKEVDMILCMTVYPGYGGQQYIMSVNDKIREIRKVVPKSYKIEVDGGINEETLRETLKAGANVIVAGTAVFNSDIYGSVKRLRECARLL